MIQWRGNSATRKDVMTINLRQYPTVTTVSYPDFSASGAALLTFDAAATNAQVAADDSLFNTWGGLLAAASARSGPVTVYFDSAATITGAGGVVGANAFPQGSVFIGNGTLPIITFATGSTLTGVSYWQDVSVTAAAGGATAHITDPQELFFLDCAITIPGNGPHLINYTDLVGGFVQFVNCGRFDGTAGPAQHVVFVTLAAAVVNIEAAGLTTIMSNSIGSAAVAADINLFTVGAGSISALQTGINAATLATTLHFGRPVALQNADDVGPAIGGAVQWPLVASEATQLSTAWIHGGADLAATRAFGVGRTLAFAAGQTITITYDQGNPGGDFALLQPDNATAIVIGLGGAALRIGGQGSGFPNSATLRASGNALTNLWTCIGVGHTMP